MGIENFAKIIKYARESEIVIYNDYGYDSECDFDVVLIDLMSYCYSNLLEIKKVLTLNNSSEESIELPQKVYEELAAKCFDKIANSICSFTIFNCREIFIAFDIKAPNTKSQTQLRRRKRGSYISFSDRLKFYKAIVREFVHSVQYHNTRIKVNYPLSFEGYKASVEYTCGEGEYIGMNYITYIHKRYGYKKFAFLGNDNDIMLLSSLINTVIPDILINYIPLTSNQNGIQPGRRYIKCKDVDTLFEFMCNTFMMGNDFLQSVYSGMCIFLIKNFFFN